jgi:hypothetical protein
MARRALSRHPHAVGVAGDSGGRIAFAWELGYMKALRAAVLAGG